MRYSIMKVKQDNSMIHFILQTFLASQDFFKFIKINSV